MRKTVVLAATLMGLFITTNADARGLQEILEECGWGGMIFPEKPQGALISNVSSGASVSSTGVVLFPLGSSTSSTSTTFQIAVCKGGEATAAFIINSSYEHLERELAAGDGDYLTLLVSFVKGEEQTEQEFVSPLRIEFTEFVSQPEFSDKNRFDKAEALYEMVVN